MEILLNELLNSISCNYNENDISTIRQKFIDILIKYDIKPTKLSAGNPDITQKVKLFISGKRLEGLSELTLKGYTQELEIFGKYINKKVEDITTSDIRLYLGSFDKLKISSLSKKLSVMKSFFSFLEDEEIIPKDPAKKINSMKKEKRFPKAMTLVELDMIRKACQTPREFALVEVLYATGCRLSEIQKMNKDDVDYKNKSARVIGKGSKERFVYFSDKSLLFIKKYLLQRLDNDPALFVSEREPHLRLSMRGIQREIKVIAKRSGIKKNIHVHIFRHTMATILLNEGCPITVIQELLGHSSSDTTAVYAQLNTQVIQQSYNQYFVQ